MPVVAYSSPFVPPEWIAAHGWHPRRLTPGMSPAAAAAGVCPFAHDFLQAVAGPRQASEPLDAVIFTATCDPMRRAAELAAGHRPTFLMHVPTTWRTPASVQLYVDELLRLGEFLVSLGGWRPSQEELVETLLAFDASRRHSTPAQDDGPGPRIALVGGPLREQNQWIIDYLRQAGAAIVLDATEYGERSLPAPVNGEWLRVDPLKELARAYFLTIPDAFRRPDLLLHDYLRQRLAATRAQAILLIRCLWCDHWHAQAGRLKESLGLPLVDVDLGQNGDDRGRTVGRLDALLETLR